MQPKRAAASGDHQASFSAGLAEGGPVPCGLTDGQGQPAGDRFRIYQNNVAVSLSEALAVTFSTTRKLMGEEFFRAAALAYARREKPRTPLLWQYGATFADFIAALPGLARYPFVADVARLEHARVQAYHSADAEPLPLAALQGLAPEALAMVSLAPHPAARLLSLSAAGISAWARSQSPPRPTTEHAIALLTRPFADVLVTPLDKADAAFAQGLFSGQTLASAGAVDGLDLPRALATLFTAGALCRGHPPAAPRRDRLAANLTEEPLP